MRAYHDARGDAPAPRHHPGLGPRHEPGVGHPRRLRGHDGALQRPRPGRRRRAARGARPRRGRHHADQPQHARAVRGGDRRDRRGGARRGRAAVLRRREPQRDPRRRAPGRHGLRHRAHEPAQDLRDAPRRGRARRGPGRGLGAPGRFPARAARRARRATAYAWTTPGALDRPGPLLARQRPRAGARARLHRRPRRRRAASRGPARGAQRQLAAPAPGRDAAGRLRPRRACTSACCARRQLKAATGVRGLDVAKRLLERGLPRADRLLPADRRRGPDVRAHRDREPPDPRGAGRRRSSEIAAVARTDPER